MRKTTFIFSGLLMIGKLLSAQTDYISTVAGTGTASFSGDGGQATAANFSYLEGVKVDNKGNIYIADYYNARIRKVDAKTGVVTTVVGNGTQGFSGDGGQATAAEINHPTDMAIDASGNIYVADWTNNRIRFVSASTGIIVTIAGTGTASFSGDGGLATAATLDYPTGLALDASGNLYVGDLANQVVRKITKSTGIITTVAGIGLSGSYSGDGGQATAATLHGPRGVAVDKAGNIYIADWANNRIRMVTVSTGIITTIAGNGTGGFSGDGGLATAAEVNTPRGVGVDAGGDVFIADWGNNRIRKIDGNTGYITTVAGDGTLGYTGDGGFATAAELNSPAEAVADSATNLFIADESNNVIRKVNGPLAIRQLTNKVTVALYPNPVVNTLYVQLMGERSSATQLAVCDITGREVITSEQAAGSYAVSNINVSGLSTGVYFIKVNIGGDQQVFKFIKQ